MLQRRQFSAEFKREFAELTQRPLTPVNQPHKNLGSWPTTRAVGDTRPNAALATIPTSTSHSYEDQYRVGHSARIPNRRTSSLVDACVGGSAARIQCSGCSEEPVFE